MTPSSVILHKSLIKWWIHLYLNGLFKRTGTTYLVANLAVIGPRGFCCMDHISMNVYIVAAPFCVTVYVTHCLLFLHKFLVSIFIHCFDAFINIWLGVFVWNYYNLQRMVICITSARPYKYFGTQCMMCSIASGKKDITSNLLCFNSMVPGRFEWNFV